MKPSSMLALLCSSLLAAGCPPVDPSALPALHEAIAPSRSDSSRAADSESEHVAAQGLPDPRVPPTGSTPSAPGILPADQVDPWGVEAVSRLSRPELRQLLARRRAARLRDLADYAREGVFPHNHDFTGERRPYLMDRHARLCAVGYLIARSRTGEAFDYRFFRAMNQQAVDYVRWTPEAFETLHRARKVKTHGRIAALFKELAAADNHVRIADIRGGPILEWILVSGLTQEECALVQPGYTYLQCDDCLPGSEMESVQFGAPTREAEAIAAKDAERIRAHLALVLLTLTLQTDASLALALRRLEEAGGG